MRVIDELNRYRRHFFLILKLFRMCLRVHFLRIIVSVSAALCLGETSSEETLLRAGRYQELVNSTKGTSLTLLGHNAVGVAHFMLGCPECGVPHFERVLESPSGEWSVSAAKNLRWSYVAINSPRVTAVETILNREVSRAIAIGERTKGFTFFDFAMQRAVCEDPMYTRNRHSQEWDSVGDGKRWRVQYFDLLKKSLTNYLYRDIDDWRNKYGTNAVSTCATGVCESEWDPTQGASGFAGDKTPTAGHSVMRLGNLNHIQLVLEDIMAKGIEGDVIEAGCFRGGTAVLMRALLDDDKRRRTVWVADSFQGIPSPRSVRGQLIDDTRDWKERYAATRASVESVFRRYGFFNHHTDKVHRLKFVTGFFNESLVALKADRFSAIHIDVDSYDSVLDVLNALYPKVSRGGYVIVDDIHLYGVREAVREYRADHGITSPLLPVPSDYTTTCSEDLTERLEGQIPKHLDLVTQTSTAYWQIT